MRLGSIVAAACIGGVWAGSAIAADLPARPMPAIAPAFTWTGFYSGIQLGGISGDFERSVQFTPPVPVAGLGASAIPIAGNRERGSALVGSRSGYLHQFGSFVIGIDTDTRIYSVTQRRLPLTTAAAVALPFPNLAPDQSSLHSGWDTSVRGRLGLAWDRFMLYGTAGVAWANIRVTTDFIANVPPTYFNRNKTVSGWTGGGGAEWAITDATSIGVEYRHSDFGNETLAGGSVSNGAVGGFSPVNIRTRFTDDAVTFNYNVRFGRIFPQLDWRLF